MELIIRPYTGLADLDAMMALLLAVRPPERIADWPGVVELREIMAREAVAAQTRLWWAATGELQAWAFVDEFANIHFERRPAAADDAHAAAMFAWASGVIAAVTPVGETATLDARAQEADEARVALLLRHGFATQPDRTLHFVCDLADPIPAADLPPGFCIRPLAANEITEVAALHRAAFGTDYMTEENRRTMMAGPEYDPTGDLVAVTPAGRLAATMIASISAVENAAAGGADGFTDPVATHPDFQRRGLARALLLEGCAWLRAHGARRACLGTSSANLAMQRAAASAGYRLDHVACWFAREVRGGHPRH